MTPGASKNPLYFNIIIIIIIIVAIATYLEIEC